jgi:hypothetical protein
LSLVGHHQEGPQIVQCFTFIQLACNTPSIVGLAIPPEDMQRFDQPSIFLQGPRQGTFARIGVDLLPEFVQCWYIKPFKSSLGF